MDKAAALEIPELTSFLNGLIQDIDAVINAIPSDFSNGLAEGTVNKIKVIKCMMYGPCQFDLLRNKCLLLDYAMWFNYLWKEPLCRLRPCL